MPFTEPLVPELYLIKRVLPGGVTAWDKTDKHTDGSENGLLVRPRIGVGLVVSHDCDIDKPNKKVLIHLAPVFPAERLENVAARQQVFEQRRPALMPLSDAPPDSSMRYADLRRIQGISFTLIRPLARVASMSDDGRTRLQAQLIAFYSRLDTTQLIIGSAP